MTKEEAYLLTPGTIVRVGDKFLGKELYNIADPKEMAKFLGTNVTVSSVKEYGFGNVQLTEVYFDEGDGVYFLIEEIEGIVEDKPLEESDMSIEDFLGIGDT